MKIIYTNDKPQFDKPSIFLAGPSPRSSKQISWRIEAIKLLKEVNVSYPGIFDMSNGYTGNVFVPEPNPELNRPDFDYNDQVEWEHECMTKCSTILFWIPRDIQNGWLGLTTNVEFGRFAHQINVVYGRPPNSDKNSYLDWYFEKCNKNKIPKQKIHRTLKDTIDAAIIMHI